MKKGSQVVHPLTADFVNGTNDNMVIHIGNEVSNNMVIHKNVHQSFIVTTEDKLKIVLIKKRESLNAQREWWTPFGLFVSLITTLLTADFKLAWGITKEQWAALFFLSTVVSGVWLLYTLVKLFKNWGAANVDNIIKEIKIDEQRGNIVS